MSRGSEEVRVWNDGNFEIETRRVRSPAELEEAKRVRMVKIARQLRFPASWNLFFDKCEKAEGAPVFPESLKLLAKIDDGATYWEWQNAPRPSELSGTCRGTRVSCGYYFFRDPVPPIWENSHHRGGGKICVAGGSSLPIDQLWIRLTSHCVGEGLNAPSGEARTPKDIDSVLGCALVLRRDSWKLSVWVPRASPAETQRLCSWMVRVCQIEPHQVSYLPHPQFGATTEGLNFLQTSVRPVGGLHDSKSSPKRGSPGRRNQDSSDGQKRHLYRREQSRSSY
jgi:hypothetical protein